jgi:nitrite reductase/ring-hydroxylating ferredoxin subunit
MTPTKAAEPKTAWPRYDAATLGFPNYWYPVMLSRSLKRRPAAVKVAGQQVALIRDGGRVYALHDRCPHRGVPLSAGRREFPGFLTCAYHGWTYDLGSGELAAVLTDGPDSPICGKAVVRVRSFPVEERAGVIWVYPGDGPAPPVEADIPQELLRPETTVEGLVELREGNWRLGIENAVDEGHAKYLHRGALWSLFSKFPAWTNGVRMAPSEDGHYLMRVRGQAVFADAYPRVGAWPKSGAFWRSPNRGPSLSLGVRLPCLARVVFRGWTDYELFVPVDEDHHLAIFLSATWGAPVKRLLFRLRYWLYVRWLYYGLLNRAQDQWMIGQMDIPPERLYRPDVSITSWRKWCHEHARDFAGESTAG